MEGALPASSAACSRARDRRAHQRWVRRQLRWRRGVAVDAELLRAGIAVVNIDNGFRRRTVAAMINRKRDR